MADEQQNIVTEKTSVQQLDTTHAVTTEPRNFLATFLFTIVGGYVGLRHFYLGNKKFGLVRAGLFVGGYAWMFVMAAFQQGILGALGVIAVLIAALWALVDFFYVYFSVRTDSNGVALVTTQRDNRWAKWIFWISVGLTALGIVLAVTFAAWAENYVKNYQPSGRSQLESPSRNSPYENAPRYQLDSSNL